MKKFFNRIFEMMILFSCLFYNFCYADVIDPRIPGTPQVPNSELPQPITESPEKLVSLIVLGVIVVIVVVAVVLILEKNGKKKETTK